MKILLAEDDTHIALIAQLSLEKIGGHQVVHVIDGESAYQKALSENFDLILLDGNLPRRTGFQVAQALKAHQNFNTPLIFLTAKAEEKDVKNFLSVGTGLIAKPFDPPLLCQKIEEILANWRKTAS